MRPVAASRQCFFLKYLNKCFDTKKNVAAYCFKCGLLVLVSMRVNVRVRVTGVCVCACVSVCVNVLYDEPRHGARVFCLGVSTS